MLPDGTVAQEANMNRCGKQAACISLFERSIQGLGCTFTFAHVHDSRQDDISLNVPLPVGDAVT